MAIRWERLTLKSQEAVQAAAGLAAESGNPEVAPVHLMAALLEDREGVVLPVLEKVGVPVQQMLAGERGHRQAAQGAGRGAAGCIAVLTRVLEQAFKEAEHFKDEYVSTEHLLLALAEEKNGVVQAALKSFGATHDAILKALERRARIQPRDGPDARRQVPGA